MWDLYILIGLVLLGYGFGKINEKNHYRSIKKREQALVDLATTSSKFTLGNQNNITHLELVTGHVVISVDYFKRLLAGLRNIFGGSVQAYETLLDRARREAILRMKESCENADEVINLRIETSSISKGRGNSIGSVEVLAYATALYRKSPE
ncbi:MAG: YbjQ family protein [Thiothrix sp.]|nr:MAG: YbjQ family protein [Thiothrix sp.]